MSEKSAVVPTAVAAGGKSKNPYANDTGEKSRLLPRGTGKAEKGVVISDADDEEDSKGNMLVFYFGLMLICALGNRLFGRLVVYPMHNYPLFVGLLLVAVYIPACFAYVIPTLMFTNKITKEQTEIPKYKFAVMGAFDAIASLLQTFFINYITSSTLVVLVGQSAIPISMIVSKLTLKSTYTVAQYMGAAVVMMGIVAVLLPKFILPPPAQQPHIPDAPADPYSLSGDGDLLEQSAAPASDFNSSTTMQLVWVMVQVLSCVPMCLSSVYKEKALGEVEIDVTYLNGWVAVFQFILAIPLCIPSAGVQGIPLSNLIPNMYGGFRCWMGENSVTEDDNPYDQKLDNCTMAPLFLTGFIFFNVLYNFLTVVILKFGSANILWLASTILVPLTNVAFSLKCMPGSAPMTVFDLIGLLIIMMGLVIYRFSDQLLATWHYLLGRVKLPDEIKRENLKKRISRQLERKQVRYMGLNQIENINALVDTRVSRAQMELLIRTPQTIRENYLLSVGVDPSPHLTVRSYAQRSPLPMQRDVNGHPLHEFSPLTSRADSFAERGRTGNTATFANLAANTSAMRDGGDDGRDFKPMGRGDSFIGVAAPRPFLAASAETRSRVGSNAPPLSPSTRTRSRNNSRTEDNRYGSIGERGMGSNDSKV